MKKLLVISLIIFLGACSSKVDKPETKEEIVAQISGHKKDIIELNKKISNLEKQLIAFEGGIKGTPVNVITIASQEFNHYFEVNGSVEAINAAFISPEINGQVKEIFVTDGQTVNKGQLLIRLNSSIVESSIKEVETGFELANTVYEKQKQLWEKNIGSELDYLQAKNNKESLESKLKTLQAQVEMAEIRAPINGIVDEVMVKEGEMAAPGIQVVQMVNLDGLYVNADVSEAYITKVQKGDLVDLLFPSIPEINMEVPIFRIGNIVKPANRTFKVQLKIKNIEEMIKPNILAKMKFKDFTEKQAIVVPSIILKQDMKGTYLFTVSDNKANKIYVETGKSYQGNTMVTNGLNAGDEVIINGYNQVSDGKLIEIM